MKTKLMLLITHLLVGFIGFAAGIYALPILTAPPAPADSAVAAMAATARYTAEFSPDLQDSDFLHQGSGPVTVGDDFITFQGSISPGPDYRLYLAAEFVETEQDFERLKPTMVQVGDVKTFDNFVVPVPADVDVSAYNTVIVWCESFGEFITAAQYR